MQEAIVESVLTVPHPHWGSLPAPLPAKSLLASQNRRQHCIVEILDLFGETGDGPGKASTDVMKTVAMQFSHVTYLADLVFRRAQTEWYDRA